MKHSLLLILVFSLLISCSENPVTSPNDEKGFDISEEAKNFPWDLVSGTIAYNRLKVGVILVDCENRKMKILKILPYLNMMTWYYDKSKVTGVDVGVPSIMGSEGRAAKFYCIDLEGNNSWCEYIKPNVHSWSNNGDFAYFTNYQWQSQSIFINQQLILSNLDYSFATTRPAWSPNENHLVLSTVGGYSDSAYSELKKFNINTKEGIPLVTADSIGFKFSFNDPIYSPDGERIAYVYRIRNIDQEMNYMTEIWIVNSDGSNKLKLTTGYVDSFPAWSPDGLKLIFQRNIIDQPEGKSEGIFIINLDGTGLQKILSNGSDMPIW